MSVHITAKVNGYADKWCTARNIPCNYSWLDAPVLRGTQSITQLQLSWTPAENAARYEVYAVTAEGNVLLGESTENTWTMEQTGPLENPVLVVPVGKVLGVETRGEASNAVQPVAEATAAEAKNYTFRYLANNQWTSDVYKGSIYFRRLVALDMSLTGSAANGAGLVAVARTQKGYHEGNSPTNGNYSALAGGSSGTNNFTEYACWYKRGITTGNTAGYAWCAYFVSWCARRAGISTSVIPSFSGCTTGCNRLLPANGGAIIYDPVLGSDYTPKKGDLVFFKDTTAGYAGHVGIVNYCSGNTVYYYDGNGASRSNDGTSTDHTQVDYRRVAKWDSTVYAYASINYAGVKRTTYEPHRVLWMVCSTTSKNMQGPDVLWVQNRLVSLGYTCPTDSVYGPNTTAAVKQFQKKKGLTVNGKVDAATLAALKTTSRSVVQADTVLTPVNGQELLMTTK